jgi:hypothetical protein
MQAALCFDIRCVRFLWGGENTDESPNPIYRNLCSPLLSVGENTQKAGRRARLRTNLILCIHSHRDISQVLYRVVESVMVEVVNDPIWPLTVYVKPSEPRSLVLVAINGNDSPHAFCQTTCLN